MFGWGKKKDGFEWHKYVRTTILVRREKRRQKVDDVRRAAADQLADAKVRGKQAAVSGAQAAGKGLSAVGRRFAHGARGLAARCWRGLKSGLEHAGTASARAAKALGHGAMRLSPRFAPVFGALSSPQYAMPFGIVAVVAAGGAAARIWVVGIDRDAMIAMGVAFVMAALAALPMMSGHASGSSLLSRLRMSRFWHAAPGRAVLGFACLVFVAGTAIAGIRYGYVTLLRLDAVVPMKLTAAEPITMKGRVAVLSGDMVWLNGEIVKLDGIDAPESGQTCHRKGWRRRWRCGAAAKDALYKLTRRRTVTCEVARKDEGGRSIAQCSARGQDLGAQMVKKGLAFAEAGLFGARYGDEQAEAKAANAGVWRGDAIHPAQFRSAKWEAAKVKAPDGCPIKGRVSRGSRIYVLPWAKSYSGLKLRKARGERWFCSEAEALAAGWRPSEKS